MTPRLSWGRCDCCGGALPLIDGDNDSVLLPELDSGGDCPGYVTDDGLCGAYGGWTPSEIEEYVAEEMED